MTVTDVDQPCSLYRVYGARKELLYVGTTLSVPVRLGQHRGDKFWWPQAVTVQVEWFPNGRAARTAEQSAIDTEHPLHNKVRAQGKTPRRTIRIPDDLWAKAQAKAEERGEDLSVVIRAALERYVKRK